ncbi:MAG: c-type cytochrome [Burkholderiales bacterium]|nr:c-type cytochrome [Burkholderiales bacterium]
MPLPIRVLLLSAALLLAACAGTEAPKSPPPSQLPPMPHPADNPPTAAKLALGKQLFADPRLSGSGRTACQSCHYREFGWADTKALSRRDDGNLNARHTPTLYNVGYQTAWYWDGRATTLDAQILAAWRAQTGADPAKATAIINAVPGYRSQFVAVWGGEATPETIVKTLAAFFRSFVSTDSPWDRHEAGQRNAVSQAAVEGQALFAGKGRCVACHAPPYYGNSTFFNIGLEHGKANPDPGRFNVTKNEADRGAFKTPTLRSVAISGPYFHDGSGITLKDAVRYMAGGGHPDPNKSAVLQPTGLTEAEIDKIVAFLESLTSTEPWQQPTLP